MCGRYVSVRHVIEQGQTTQVEPWYGTEFSQEAIPEDWLLRWQAPNHPADLHLPHNNPFISSDFTLIDVGPLNRKLGNGYKYRLTYSVQELA